MTDHEYGFRILGDCRSQRRSIDWELAFAAYAACDEHAEVDSEAYLSAFTFPEEFDRLLENTGTVRGYTGSCFASWIWWDIDIDRDLFTALAVASKLARFVLERYELDDEHVLLFFSGAKGFHVGIPASLVGTSPSEDFHRHAKAFALATAKRAGVSVDTSVYDRVRAFRAPNSRHPKSGLFKRLIRLSELSDMDLREIKTLAEEPRPFEVPEPLQVHEQASADWQSAVKELDESESELQQWQDSDDAPRLNRRTLDFIRDGAVQGEREVTLYSAARNIGDLGCTATLAHALLTKAGLDCGLRPGIVHRQIECGVKDSKYGSLKTPDVSSRE